MDDSLAVIYEKMAYKFQMELNKTTTVLSQKLAALGNRTDMLETKHNKLLLAYSDLSKDHEALSETVVQLQALLEDLDNRCNNICIHRVPESTTDMPAELRKFS